MTNEQLSNYDYVVMIDKSGSMSTNDCPGGRSRWAWVQEQALNLARKCAEFDNDGIDVVVFAGTPKDYKGVTPDKVEQIFKENSPGGSTDTAAAIKLVIDGYFSRKSSGSAKPLIVLCFTDGAPNDQNEVANVIINATKKMDADEELAITFLQVGGDQGARSFLKFLDDGLEAKGAKFDIVDTKNDSEMDGLSTEDILIQAVTD